MMKRKLTKEQIKEIKAILREDCIDYQKVIATSTQEGILPSDILEDIEYGFRKEEDFV